MEIKIYLNLLKRWWWLLVLGAVLGVGGGYLATKYQTKIYQASTKVLAMAAPDEFTSGVSNLNNQQLAQTLTELLTTRPVLAGTAQVLGYGVGGKQISIEPVRGSQLIEVTVENNDPQHAADIANTIVAVFLEQNEALQASRFSASEESLLIQLQQVENQISDLETELTEAETELTRSSEENLDARIGEVTKTIAALQEEIRSLQERIAELGFPPQPVESVSDIGRIFLVTPTPSIENLSELAVKMDRLKEIQDLRSMYQSIYVDIFFKINTPDASDSQITERTLSALTLYRQIYSNLLSNLEAIRLARLRSAPNVIQVEEAVPPSKSIKPNPIYNFVIGGTLGLLISGVIAFAIEYLDNTLRTPDDVINVLQLPILGYIGEMKPAWRRKGKERLPYIVENPRAPEAEALRSLRTNLEFAGVDKHINTLYLTSPGVSEGKTTIAVNLAVVIAQSGKQVFLLDADLRRPNIHHVLSIPNSVGLSDILRDRSDIDEASSSWKYEQFSVITSGKLPPNPAEVLSSEKMAKILEDIKEKSDMVIIDGPPFMLADASVLSSRADGVLIVIRLNRTQADEALSMLEQLERSGARVIGVVLNYVRRRETKYFYKGYRDYTSFSYDDSDQPTLGLSTNDQSAFMATIAEGGSENEMPNQEQEEKQPGVITRLLQWFKKGDNHPSDHDDASPTNKPPKMT
jgi:succinoglycan biosynthesis transport protein ExoP